LRKLNYLLLEWRGYMTGKCSKQQSQEGQVDELQAGIEQSFAVFPESSAFGEPGEAAFDDPALGHDLEGVQLTVFGDLYRDRLAQDGTDALRERLAGVAAIIQEALDTIQARRVVIERFERALSIGYVRRRHGEGVRQSLGIDRDVSLDPRDLLPRIVALLSSSGRICSNYSRLMSLG
jgi:hypothetical protein